MLDKEYHIRGELLKAGIYFRESRTNFKIKCFDSSCNQGEHKSHPYKLEILKDGSKVHCWRCDYSGSWNTLAIHLGLTPFSKQKEFESFPEDLEPAKFVQQQVNASLEFSDEELPKSIEPWNGLTGKGEDWRELSVDFLSKIPTYRWHQVDSYHNHVERILFPFYQKTKLMGYTGRRLDNNSVMRYDNASFTKSIKTLFPFDYVSTYFPNTDKVVLVEGPVDALVLCQYGIPTLSILGTSNWSQSKIDTLISVGIRKVILLMDGDVAGIQCSKSIIDGNKKKNFVRLYNVMDKVKSIRLTDGLDPATLSEDELSWLENEFAKF